MSAFRFAMIAHGVMQAVGTSRPVIVASAPDGVDEMLMFSLVPRVTDAQPPTAAASATTPRTRMLLLPQAQGDYFATLQRAQDLCLRRQSRLPSRAALRSGTGPNALVADLADHDVAERPPRLADRGRGVAD